MGKPLTFAPKNKASDVAAYPKGSKVWTDLADGEKPVLFSETGFASAKVCPSKTMIEVMQAAAKKHPGKIALRTENMPAIKKGERAPDAVPLDKWTSWTWESYMGDTRRLSKALLKVGHVQHDAVNVFGFNSPQWLISQMGCIFAGGKVAGIYPSDTTEQVQFKSFHSNASVALVEGQSELAKFSEVIDQLPYLKAVVVWACVPGADLRRKDGSVCRVYAFDDFLKLGGEVADAALETRIAQVRSTHCCALIYTSGTTGKPKAVMISHDNLMYQASAVLPLCGGVGASAEEERILSYLPLSHVAGMMVDAIFPLVCTAFSKGWMSVNFARVYDLKIGTIGQRLGVVRPTMFIGVPRVWEKIMEKLQAVGASATGLKKSLATTAKAKGLQASLNQQLGGSGKVPFLYGVYGKLLAVIKTKLGLDQCKFAFAGAAHMTKDVLSYFGSLGINVNEVYGMSESTGAVTWSTDAAHQWGTVGFEMPGTEVKCFKLGAPGQLKECPRAADIMHPTEAEQGELCFRGRNIMMGYLSNPKLGDKHVEEIRKKNAEAIDAEGWLHSGDKGAVGKNGMVRITGRYKELIIGAGGENIAPVPIEDNIKKLCPFVSNVMMYGDKRKFNIALLTLKSVGATGELPGTHDLDGAAKVYGKTIAEACANPKLIEDITNAFKATAKDGDCTPSNAAVVQKFSVLPIDFSVATGELTATLKLKCSEVGDKYAKLIDAIYESADNVVFFNYGKVASFDAVKGKAEELRGSFKANSPLDMVDDEHAAQLAVSTGVKAHDEEEPQEEDKRKSRSHASAARPKSIKH